MTLTFNLLTASDYLFETSIESNLKNISVDNIPNTLDLVDANGNIDYNRITTFNAVDFATLIDCKSKGFVPELIA